jgi:hypothetical protein
MNLLHSSCAHGEGSVWDRGRGMGQVRSHLAGSAAPAGPVVPGSCGTLVPFPPECAHVHKNCNTTRETLLVSKICMKHVLNFSQTRGFDSQIFVVRTVYKLPKAKCLLVLEQSLDLASVDRELQDVIIYKYLHTNSMLFLLI